MNTGFNLKEFLRYRRNDAKKAAAVVFAVGVVLMIIGGEAHTDKTESTEIKTETAEHICDETERKMEEILGRVSGAGKVKVMITYSQGSEMVAAQQIKKEENEDSRSYESNYVFKEKSDGSTDALILTEYMPLPVGVVIVAQGGDNIYVKQALSTAAQVLLDVPAHKVEVFKMEG